MTEAEGKIEHTECGKQNTGRAVRFETAIFLTSGESLLWLGGPNPVSNWYESAKSMNRLMGIELSR
jgi:hypothetical protein